MPLKTGYLTSSSVLPPSVAVHGYFSMRLVPNAGGEPPRHERRPHAIKLPLARSAPLLCSAMPDARLYLTDFRFITAQASASKSPLEHG
jgi:hypothetical protein